MRCVATFVLCALLPGCYESFTVPEGRDGATPVDGASPIADASVPPTPSPPVDAARRGVCDLGELVPPYDGPGCAPDTLACLEGCMSEPTAPPDCSDGCVAADPECILCFNQSIVSCSNRIACQGEWNAFACCAELQCPAIDGGIDRLACAGTGACTAELDAYTTCADGGGFEACSAEIQRCFDM